jgi:tetratricopeptide (TPR) repeat protein
MLLCAAGLALTGCQSAPRVGVKPASSGAAVTNAAVLDGVAAAAAAKRAEALARFAAGLSYEFREEPDKALSEFHLAALADPGNEALAIEVSRRLIQRKEQGKAIEILTKAAAWPTASGMIFSLLGAAYAQAAQPDLAMAANRTAIQKLPQSITAYQNLTQLYLQHGKPSEVLPMLELAAKQPDLDVPFLVDLAELMSIYLRAQSQDAEKVKPRVAALLERAAQLKPTDPALRQRMAEGYAVAGLTVKAAEIYLSLLTQFQDQPALRDMLRGKLTDVYMSSGNQQDKKLAAEQLEALKRDHPTNPQVYLFLSGLAYGEKNYQRAADNLEMALKLNPKLEQAYYDLAGVQIALEKGELALKTIEQARAKFPRNFTQEFTSALAYSSLKQYAKSLTYYNAAEVLGKAGETNRLSHIFYFQFAATHERNKDYVQAEKYFDLTLQLSPDFVEALNYCGYMFAEQGIKLDKARVMIERAIKAEPENAAFLDSMGWVLYRLNQPQQALPYMLKALKFSEKPDATLQDHLGDIYAALKKMDQARAAWQKSLTIEPNEAIQKKLDAVPVPGRSPK